MFRNRLDVVNIAMPIECHPACILIERFVHHAPRREWRLLLLLFLSAVRHVTRASFGHRWFCFWFWWHFARTKCNFPKKYIQDHRCNSEPKQKIIHFGCIASKILQRSCPQLENHSRKNWQTAAEATKLSVLRSKNRFDVFFLPCIRSEMLSKMHGSWTDVFLGHPTNRNHRWKY